MKSALSIVIPAYNEAKNIGPLLERINQTCLAHELVYEAIVIDDHSTDNTAEVVAEYAKTLPVSVYQKQKQKGKAQSLREGFAHVQYPIIAMIDADLQYPPEAIPEMAQLILENQADVVVGQRDKSQTPFFRKLVSSGFSFWFARMLHRLPYDVQSGLKVFRKETIDYLPSRETTPWAFDLPFLLNARTAGFRIASLPIRFDKRASGKTKVGVVKAAAQIGASAISLKAFDHGVVQFPADQQEREGKGFYFNGHKYIHHTNLEFQETALYRVSPYQIMTLVLLLLVVLDGLIFDWHRTAVIAVAIVTCLYFADLLFNLYLIVRSFSKAPEIHLQPDELAAVTEWPAYTILCPLYKEWNIMPQFITAMQNLDYPKDKLQVMLLLEEDDTETIAKVKTFDLPPFFDIEVVPSSLPKTKPKACNYGLTKATGEYVVIYDAEDIPDPDQLKKAIVAFDKAPKNTVCIQAKLNFYNPHQNILTRVFTAEYSLWFDLVLTGLQIINAPIPLGGTSNHFRLADLQAIKGWDSFNVTEDCDLGIRLAKCGMRTALIDSLTLEEANSSLSNWFTQRTRWVKGYMQTYLVHMRKPKDFLRDWKQPHVITFQLIVGGKVLSMLLNPFMWLVTISYFILRAHVGAFIESFFPLPILYMAVTALILGNFLYIYYYMLGCYKREHEDIIKYMFLVPIYWLCMSAAAYIAIYQLLFKPHHWSKTKHGLHLDHAKTMNKATKRVGRALIDKNLESPALLPTVAYPESEV